MKHFPTRKEWPAHAGGTVDKLHATERDSAAVLFPNQQRIPMNSSNGSHEVIVTGIHLELTPSLKFYVREKMERLFRHESHIVRVKVELECDRTHDRENKFLAKGHVQLRGPDINATVSSEECHKSIDLLVDKLDQAVRKRHSHAKDKRNHPHAVEWQDVTLPKAI
jgi:putative sigma-54 modulation protein